MLSILCGNCQKPHHSEKTVRGCHEGTDGACQWPIENGWDDDGRRDVIECGADAVLDARGWRCTAGHEQSSVPAHQRIAG